MRNVRKCACASAIRNFFAESNSTPKNKPIYKKSAQNIMFVGIYNRYAQRAQMPMRKRNSKFFLRNRIQHPRINLYTKNQLKI